MKKILFIFLLITQVFANGWTVTWCMAKYVNGEQKSCGYNRIFDNSYNAYQFYWELNNDYPKYDGTWYYTDVEIEED